jgi:hypothetical protein
MAEWSKACDSSESLPEFQVSHRGIPAWVRIPFLSDTFWFSFIRKCCTRKVLHFVLILYSIARQCKFTSQMFQLSVSLKRVRTRDTSIQRKQLPPVMANPHHCRRLNSEHASLRGNSRQQRKRSETKRVILKGGYWRWITARIHDGRRYPNSDSSRNTSARGGMNAIAIMNV